MRLPGRLIAISLIVTCLLSVVHAQTNGGDEVPPDYKSDGCTLFPDGNYRDCCVAHDKDYYKGGSCKERLKSDNRLYNCVRNKKGWQNKIIAPIMWIGVRVGGVGFLPTPFRWGFGKKKIKKKRMTNDEPVRENKHPDVVDLEKPVHFTADTAPQAAPSPLSK